MAKQIIPTTETPHAYKVTGFKCVFQSEKVYSFAVVHTNKMVMSKYNIPQVVNRHFTLDKAEKAMTKFLKKNPEATAVIAPIVIYEHVGQE